jgi:ANTAR domain
MTAQTIAEAFADAAARLTGGVDVAGDLVALLADCTALMQMDSAGLLVDVPGEGLALLSSTSHTTTVLELYELQNGLGPCIQAIEDNAVVSAAEAELEESWEPVGRAVVDAGYSAVHAFPLRWHERAVGALNLFATDVRELDEDRRGLGQAFANMAIAILAQSRPASWAEVHQLILGVLDDRIVIEQAKGVLAVQYDTDLSEAYTLLVTNAGQQGIPLSELAAQVLVSTRRPSP